MDEFELIATYFTRPQDASGVVIGVGDDGAVLEPEPGRELVTVVDTLVAGVHYPESMSAFDVGYRAVAINLSDIAAMGARPRWMTLALTLASAREVWLHDFAEGLFAAAAEHGVALVGGDTTAGEQVVVTVQITGDVARGAALRRDGARSGDTIFITGTVGDAAAGRETMDEASRDDDLVSRFLRPVARVDYGQALTGIASAAIDISDGLYADLEKLLSASGCGAAIDLERLPLSAALRKNFPTDAQRRFALAGGDDYELLFTARAAELPDARDHEVTAIGEVTGGAAIVCRDKDGVVDYRDSGYRHFA